MDFEQFEKKIGVSFKNKGLLKQAFTHRSFINENKRMTLEHNERLEFLGDAVLELVSTVYLYKKYPNKNEGDLTSYRSALVNAIILSSIAVELNMDDFLLLSKGESKDKGKARQIILANTMEALIGAIFLDQGYKEAENFINKYITPHIDDIVVKGTWIDAKSLFQEKSQEIEGITPMYKVSKELGPDHDKFFTVGVYLRDALIASGDGKSKQEAEQKAAENGLKKKGW
ncbi:MAG: ribonuclease III [Candidatus Taylorbacteria bacterium]